NAVIFQIGRRNQPARKNTAQKFCLTTLHRHAPMQYIKEVEKFVVKLGRPAVRVRGVKFRGSLLTPRLSKSIAKPLLDYLTVAHFIVPYLWFDDFNPAASIWSRVA